MARPPLSDPSQRKVPVSLSLSAAERDRLQALGGARWLAAVLATHEADIRALEAVLRALGQFHREPRPMLYDFRPQIKAARAALARMKTLNPPEKEAP